jgi:hypothetical protein
VLKNVFGTNEVSSKILLSESSGLRKSKLVSKAVVANDSRRGDELQFGIGDRQYAEVGFLGV